MIIRPTRERRAGTTVGCCRNYRLSFRPMSLAILTAVFILKCTPVRCALMMRLAWRVASSTPGRRSIGRVGHGFHGANTSSKKIVCEFRCICSVFVRHRKADVRMEWNSAMELPLSESSRTSHPGVPANCALAIELSSAGFANSRIRAPLHVHLRSPGPHPSSWRGPNKELVLGASELGGGAAQTKDRTRRAPAVPGGSGGFHGT